MATYLDIVRRAAEAAGRDPSAIEMITGCPDALPGSGQDPLAAVDERHRRGVGRIVLPISPFLPSLEESLPLFGERVIRAFADD